LEDWLKTIDVNVAAVADVGGRKLPVKDRVRSWVAKRYDILDLPEYDLNQAWSLKDIYNIVFCLEVFEYVYNPLQAMTNLYEMLKSGGELYASFQFIYPHHAPEGRDYLRYTRWGVEKLAKEAGFRSVEIRPRTFHNQLFIFLLYFSEKMKGVHRNPDWIHREQGYLLRGIK
jgi:hypothetical protein